MNNRDKENIIKEKLKQALVSTARVISEDFRDKNSKGDNKNSKEFDILNLENINSKSNFIKARAEFDSAALKKNFQIKKFLNKIYLSIHHANRFILLQKKLDMSA